MKAKYFAPAIFQVVLTFVFTSISPSGSAQTAPALPTASATSAPSPSPAASSKKPGVTRLALALPKTQFAQPVATASSAAEALRTSETQYLRGPGLEIVPISAMIPVQIAAELKESDCDYLLYSSLVEKTGTGSAGLLKKAMPFAGMLPMAGMLGGVAGAVTTSAASVALSGTAGLAGDVKAKSEMTLTYKLVRLNNGVESPVLENTIKAKATRDGEDIISPMLEQAATAIVGKISAKS